MNPSDDIPFQDRRKVDSGWNSAFTLSRALPFIQRHAGATIVVKFGGHAMGTPELTAEFAKDIVLLRQVGLRPVVVHGGGPQIGSMLSRLDIKTEFKDGLRVSDMETVGVAEMVLSGAINKSLVSAINCAGGRAVGLSGRDARLITAAPKGEGLGFTGIPAATDVRVLNTLADAGFIPVVSPISADETGDGFNINADTAAGCLAAALTATRLILMTDVAGVLDTDKHLLTDLSRADVQGLIDDGTAQGGMIPKLQTAMDAVGDGVEAVVILDGRRAHGLLVELFTDDGAGTLIHA
ncbi:acetylglutamate kinase [Algimonas porphyrae]|uniref:Acetylglutamate kinase n=1 Tax=Algimonas porphyrae TaxID=1128113 RepID=A0ABQ5V4U1_9PROT|nr:acetylglutamate kinase [Algimonas porphyrae]GLQ21695.1 acetylglutamate kinase [Algimonas porphyrae]